MDDSDNDKRYQRRDDLGLWSSNNLDRKKEILREIFGQDDRINSMMFFLLSIMSALRHPFP